MKNKYINRRNFLHKIVGITALGSIASLVLGNKVVKVSGADIQGTIADKQIAYGDTTANTIAGSDHLKWDNAQRNFIGGYSGNKAETSDSNPVRGCTISGGGGGGPYWAENKVTDEYCTIGGGTGNQAGDDDENPTDEGYATVSGGFHNTASGWGCTVGGGDDNTAGTYNSTVGGGSLNTASEADSTVAGGYRNTASGQGSTVGGGTRNTASGYESTVLGGYENSAAGDHSLAAGRRAKIDAAHDGAFLFADHNNRDFDSTAANEFAIRCTGGARFVTAIDGSGNPTTSTTIDNTGKLSTNSIQVNSAQRTTIPIDVRTHDITVPAGIIIDTNAMIFVTIMNNSSNIGVRWVERLSDTQFRVHLTGLSRNVMNIGYFIVN